MARYALIAGWLLLAQTADAFLSAPRALGRIHAPAILSKAPHVSRRGFSTPLQTLSCSAETTALVAWLEENGCKANCEPSGSESGRGLSATTAIKKGDDVCVVPLKVMMTEETAAKALGPKANELDAETAIALQLLKEKAEGDASFYAPWIKTLPAADKMDVPLMWSEAERGWLEGTKVGEDVEELEENLEDELGQLTGAGWDKILGGLTLEDYKWATSIVSSRSFSLPKLPGGVALVPLADFAAHSGTGGTYEVSFEGIMRAPHLKVRAGDAVEKGGDVRVAYPGSVVGGSDNSALLFKRGLSDLTVVGGSFDTGFGVSGMDRFKDDKEDILEQAGFATEETFTLTSDEMDWEDVPQSYWDMMAYLRLVCITASDAFLLESVFRNEVWEFMQYPVSKENEKLVLDTLVGTVEGALEGFETTEGEDARAQASEDLPLRERMAAAARLGERKALGVALQTYLSDLDTLDSKEYYQERRLQSLGLDRPIDESEIVDPDIEIRRQTFDDMY